MTTRGTLMDRTDLIPLAQDRSIPELKLRLRLLRMACLTTAEAVTSLGMSRATYYRTVSPVRQKPRSDQSHVGALRRCKTVSPVRQTRRSQSA